jgi:RNA polymerase sigma factor (sigma-70 family)
MSKSSSSLSLGDVAALALDARCAFVRQTGDAELEAAVSRLRRSTSEMHRGLTVDRLAWAVAFNVDGGQPGGERNTRAKRSYLDYWTPETPWSQVWGALGAPRQGASGAAESRSILTELAASVACEQRGDWQHPTARRLDPALAESAFAELYDRNRSTVVAHVTKQFKRHAGHPEDVANEAWSRVFLDYWSKTARRRILGTSAISSLVCGAAYFVACDIVRRQGKMVPRDEPDAGETGARARPLSPGEALPPNQPGAIAAAELTRHVKACRALLPARQQLVARMVWDHEMRQVDLARKLGVSPPAVNQLLEKARRSMHKCLKDKGFSVSSGSSPQFG